MWKIKLDSERTCAELVGVCQDFKQVIPVNVCYGRYMVDGCSILGLLSLIPHTVDIWVPEMNEIIIKNFTDELKKIGAYYEEN